MKKYLLIFRKFFRINRIKDYKSKLFLNLRVRLVFLITLILLFSLISFSLIGYFQTRSALLEKSYQLSIRKVMYVNIVMDSFLEDIKKCANVITSNNTMQKYFFNLNNSGYNNKTENTELNSIIKIFNENKIKSIYFLGKTKAYKVYPGLEENQSFKKLFLENWYEEALNNTEEVSIIGTNIRFGENGDYNYVVSASKLLNPANPASGMILIDFDYGYLSDKLESQTFNTSNSELYIYNENGFVMYNKNSGVIGLKQDYYTLNSLSPKIPDIPDLDKKLKAVYLKNQSTAWLIADFINQKSIAENLNTIRNKIILLISLFVIILSIVSLWYLTVLLEPLNKFSKTIWKNHSKYSYNINNKSIFSKESPVNELENFDSLADKVYDIQLKQKEAELKSLHSQINPHFLYNTLDSIRGAAIHNGIKSIAEMAKRLSMIFRYSISEEILVPVIREIRNIENYIAIQNFRHDNKFQLVYNIPHNYYDYKIPKLTLQPLIENSIKHGLEMQLCKGLVKIELRNLQDSIIIEIYDNGTGIVPEKLNQLNAQLTGNANNEQKIESYPNQKSGIGILNVNSRIKLLFGLQYGVKYIECSKGTIVQILLPIIQ